MSMKKDGDLGTDSVESMLAFLCSPQQHCFFAYVITRMERRPAPGMGTMGVGLENGMYTLFYDPDFAKTLTPDLMKVVLEHEVYHVMLSHIPRLLRMVPSYQGTSMYQVLMGTANIAMDAALHELLRKSYPKLGDFGHEMLDKCVLSERVNLPANCHYELYQQIMLERYKEFPNLLENLIQQLNDEAEALKGPMGKSGSGGPSQPGEGEKDEGEGEGEGEGQGNEENQQGKGGLTGDPLLDEMLLNAARSHLPTLLRKPDNVEGMADRLDAHGREIVSKAYEQYTQGGKNAGDLGGLAQQLLEKFLAPPLVPWEDFFRETVERTHQTKRGRGMRRPSKSLMAVRRTNRAMRRLMPYPGLKRDRRFTIYFCRDTSGSMSDHDCKLAFAQLENIKASIADVELHIFDADTEVKSTQIIESGDEIDWTRTGYGGTSFEAVFRYTLEQCIEAPRKPDVLVFATDGYDRFPSTVLPIPVVWLITPGGSVPEARAGHTVIEMRDKEQH